MAIWPWRAPVSVAAGSANDGALRRHGILRSGIALAVACIFWFTGHHTMASVVASIGAVTLLAALLSPQGLYARLTRALDAFGHAVGIAITYLFLVPIYFLIFTPMGLIMRLGSRDPLHRRWSAQTTSFWTTRPATDDAPERRKRPF